MKVLSYLTLAALLSMTACSHHKKACCKDKAQEEKCKDGHCEKNDKDEKKDCCKKDHCEKKKQ